MRRITAEDLDRCAAHAAAWHRAGCATPLLLTQEEFAGSLDAFPIEYGEILETHRVIFGASPFQRVGDCARRSAARVRGAGQEPPAFTCARTTSSAAAGRREIAALVHEAAPAFAVILRRLARLDGAPADNAAELSAYAARRARARCARRWRRACIGEHPAIGAGVDAARIYPAYLAAVERLWHFIDGWRAEAR